MSDTFGPAEPLPATDVPVRLRNDLEFFPQDSRGGRVWVIKDPISIAYFQFREEEYQLLRWLDGRCDVRELIRRFEQRFAPQRLSKSRVMAFLARLHRSGLVVSDAVGQGNWLAQRDTGKRFQGWLAVLANPLAIRLPGINPTRALDWIYPRMRWVFAPGFITACAVFMLLVAIWTLVSFDEVIARMPDGHRLLSPQNLLMLAATLAGTKLLHELGHALTCKHHGAVCHEMGLMFLVFTPCLYCDVSDAWTLGDRWRRLAISAAGICVELFLAAVCTVLWWFSQPGLANSLFFNVMLVCSVGTVLLNGNPLMRYDGYYLLSDGVRYPNLWHQSGEPLRRTIWKYVFGIPIEGRRFGLAQSLWLSLYKIASLAYRIVVVVVVLYIAHRFLKPQGLQLLSLCLILAVVSGLLATPLTSFARTLRDPRFRTRMNPQRLFTATGMLTLLLAGLFVVPLPCRVKAPVTLHAKDARRIYVTVPGRLVEAVQAGQRVQAGDVLARLENLSLEQQLERIRGQVLVQRQRLKSLESLRMVRSDLAEQLPTAREMLDDLIAQRDQLEQEIAALTLTAPIAGRVIAPPRTATAASLDGRLPRWSGSPLEQPNRGVSLDRQTLICMIDSTDSFDAVAYVHQSDIGDVRVGQNVSLSMDLRFGGGLTGTIHQVSLAKITEVPQELAIDGRLDHRRDTSGVARPDETWYQVRISLDDQQRSLLIGARGTASIQIAPQPLGRRFLRFLQRTFKPIS